MVNTLVSPAALAALSAAASFAQSSVTISGTFDPSFVSQTNTYGNGNSVTQTGLQNNRQGTSNVTFKGTEDLGGGLQAAFLIENDFDSTKQTGTSNFLGSAGGEVYAGLIGGFGSIKLGAPNTPTLYTQSSANPFGTKLGSGFGAMNTSHVRNNNTIVYATPAVNGFSAQVAYSTKTNADTNPSTAVAAAGAITDIGLFYANGPLAVGYSRYNVASTTSGAADNTQNNAYVTYDLGVAKLGAGYYTEKNGAAASSTVASGATDSTAYNLSVAVPVGAVTLMANYGKKDDKATANNNRTVAAVGAKYALSKNTSLYARYVSDKIDGSVNAALVAKATYTLVGLQTNF